MKRFAALLLISLFLIMSVPVGAVVSSGSDMLPAATSARKTLLDLSNATSSQSSTAQGWAFNPTGDNGHPKLTLNGYGLQADHSAPIILPPNTLIEVNGDCYIDNSYMNADHDVITARCNGYLHINGSGTLNLYSENYLGSSISKESGSASNHNDDLVIENVTVNCYNHERDMYTAFDNKPCIYAYKSMTIRNAVINAYYGGCGLRIWGETPIGGVTEETADEILIENSIVNLQNESENGLLQFAKGIENTFGRTRITGDSHVTINGGSKSIYTYLSLVIDGGTVDILSTPVASNTDVYALVQANCIKIGSEVERVHFAAAKYSLSTVIYCKQNYLSTLADGLTVSVGSYNEEGFAQAIDPATGLPALKIVNNDQPTVLIGDVNLNGTVEFADITLLTAYILNLVTLSPQALLNANANGDNLVNILDVPAIYAIIFSN